MICLNLLPLAAALIVQPSQMVRLRLHPGQVFQVSLRVERDGPKTNAEIRHTVSVKNAQSGILTLHDDLKGMTIDGKDRSADLKKALSVSAVTFSWNDRAQRTGDMTGISIARNDPQLMPVLQEAGLYLCEFPEKAIKPGDSWYGSTTATGGCTMGKYTLREFTTDNEKRVAIIEVTDIRFQVDVTPVGPMVMTVNLKNGLPEKVEYSVRGKKSGRISHYVQTIATT